MDFTIIILVLAAFVVGGAIAFVVLNNINKEKEIAL